MSTNYTTLVYSRISHVLLIKIESMKAARLRETDRNKNIIIDEVGKPVASDNKILVEVSAAGVNPFDIYVSRGQFPAPLPITLGGDFSGIVREIGPDVADFIEGDEVYGSANVFSGGSGSFAQYALANPKETAVKPGTIDFLEAGAIPLTGVSAIQGLIDIMNLSRGQNILIHGGAGGIGTVSIQLAKHLGASVTTTVNNNDIEYVLGLGADKAIDYKTQKIDEMINNFDAVFDLVGGETYTKSFPLLKRGGILVSMKEKPNEELMKKYEVKAFGEMTEITTERLNMLTELINRGVIKVKIDKVFSLDEAKEALKYLEDESPNGKVVIKLK